MYNSILPEFKRRVSYNISLEQIEFLPANILKAVKQIKNKRLLDPNGFSSGFIKKINCPLVKPLCVCCFLLCLRIANIIPVFKKGCSSVCRPSNYRHSCRRSNIKLSISQQTYIVASTRISVRKFYLDTTTRNCKRLDSISMKSTTGRRYLFRFLKSF